MALSTGHWKLNSNGFEGVLEIRGVDGQGTLSAKILGNPTLGFWDEKSKKIMLVRLTDPGKPASFQIYTGYLFQNANDEKLSTLAGYFEAFSGTGGTAQRNVFGWFAQITVGPE